MKTALNRLALAYAKEAGTSRRVQGYRPSRRQLEELLALAQKGIEENAIARLESHQGDEQFYTRRGIGKVESDNLSEMISDAGNPAKLSNLHFSIDQTSPPSRSVEVYIGPGDWTDYRVESDDQTWALGRYHELTDKLLADRTWYAKHLAPNPERFGNDDHWYPTPWEVTTDWRTLFLTNGLGLLWALLVVEISLGAFIADLYYLPSGSSQQERLQERQSALYTIHLISHSAFIYVGLNITT